MPRASAYISEQVQSKQVVPAIARLLSSEKIVWAVVLFTTTIAIAWGALSENRALFDTDEEIYLRVIKIFQEPLSLELLRSYKGEPASPAPLFFIIYAWFGKLFGFSYSVFRGGVAGDNNACDAVFVCFPPQASFERSKSILSTAAVFVPLHLLHGIFRYGGAIDAFVRCRGNVLLFVWIRAQIRSGTTFG